MQRNFYFNNFQRNLNRFQKFYVRLLKKVRSGSFRTLAKKQQAFLLNRLRELVSKLEQLKPGFAATVAGTSLAMLLAANASAQTFTREPSNNPLSSVTLAYAKPTFADLDNDGDQDAVIGNAGSSSGFTYYKNTGSATNSVFTQQTGSSNPFNSFGLVNGYFAPNLVDIDGDGDYDILSGYFYYSYSTYSTQSELRFYKNTGTSANPTFQLQSSANSLFSTGTAPTSDYMTPATVDIDGDGDKDLFLGQYDGSVVYYKNTGTATAASFTLQTSNPLAAVSVNSSAAPALADVDNDGDYDALIGARTAADIAFFKNTGTSTAPVFTAETGTNNPLDTLTKISALLYAGPAFVDIDNDGDQDLFVGDNAYSSGVTRVEFFRNDLTNTSATGTASAVTASNVTVFPSPANDVLNISLGSQTGSFPLSVVNATGMEVKNTTISAPGTTLNVGNLTSGIYVLKIGTATVKFVKQ